MIVLACRVLHIAARDFTVRLPVCIPTNAKDVRVTDNSMDESFDNYNIVS